MKRFGQRGEMARDLVHQTVGIGGFSNARKIRDVGEQDCDFPPNTAKLGGDGAIDNSLHDILWDKASEGPDTALGDRHCRTQLVYFRDKGCDRLIVGLR